MTLNTKITLYSTNCPKCRVLEMKLDSKGVEYETCTDTDRMVELGMSSAPSLEVDGKLMGFKESMAWLSSK